MLTYPPGTFGLHLVHINCVIRPSPKCVKLDVSCHTWYLNLPLYQENNYHTCSEHTARRQTLSLAENVIRDSACFVMAHKKKDNNVSICSRDLSRVVICKSSLVIKVMAPDIIKHKKLRNRHSECIRSEDKPSPQSYHFECPLYVDALAPRHSGIGEAVTSTSSA